MSTPNVIRQQLKAQRLLVTLLGSCGTVLILVLCWFGFASPILRDQRDAVVQQSVIAQLRSQEKQIADRFVQASSEAKHWQELDQARRQRCSPNLDDSSFLRWLNQQADNSGLQIKDFRPLARQNEQDYISQGFAIAAQGSYRSVCQFLDAMRRCPQMNRITSMDMTPKDSAGDSFTLTIQGLLFTAQTPEPSQAREG